MQPYDRPITPRAGRFPSVFHDHHGGRGWGASVHFRDLELLVGFAAFTVALFLCPSFHAHEIIIALTRAGSHFEA